MHYLAETAMNSPRLGSGIVAGQTGGLEVVGLALRNVRFGSETDILVARHDVRLSPTNRHALER
jgi:hypothetical protein